MWLYLQYIVRQPTVLDEPLVSNNNIKSARDCPKNATISILNSGIDVAYGIFKGVKWHNKHTLIKHTQQWNS